MTSCAEIGEGRWVDTEKDLESSWVAHTTPGRPRPPRGPKIDEEEITHDWSIMAEQAGGMMVAPTRKSLSSQPFSSQRLSSGVLLSSGTDCRCALAIMKFILWSGASASIP